MYNVYRYLGHIGVYLYYNIVVGIAAIDKRFAVIIIIFYYYCEYKRLLLFGQLTRCIFSPFPFPVGALSRRQTIFYRTRGVINVQKV